MVATATAAAAAAADVDTTLDFDPAVLRDLYENISPYIVGLPVSPGVIVRSTQKHDLVAVHTKFVEDVCMPETVMYCSNGMEAVVEAVAVLSADVSILFAKRKGEPLPDIGFSSLAHHDAEKVVTFFPYMDMDTVAMFKGHVVLKDAISREIGGAPVEQFRPWSTQTFSFTCPYAYSHNLEDEDGFDLYMTHMMTLGAPAFNLSGRMVGTLCAVGDDYNVKFARGHAYLHGLLENLWGKHVKWLKGEEIVRSDL